MINETLQLYLLTAAIHADALDVLNEDYSRALAQEARDEEALQDMDNECRVAQESLERVIKMASVLTGKTAEESTTADVSPSTDKAKVSVMKAETLVRRLEGQQKQMQQRSVAQRLSKLESTKRQWLSLKTELDATMAQLCPNKCDNNNIKCLPSTRKPFESLPWTQKIFNVNAEHYSGEVVHEAIDTALLRLSHRVKIAATFVSDTLQLNEEDFADAPDGVPAALRYASQLYAADSIAKDLQQNQSISWLCKLERFFRDDAVAHHFDALMMCYRGNSGENTANNDVKDEKVVKSFLSPHYYCCLPQGTQAAQLLLPYSTVDDDASTGPTPLLPPVRHIVTHRFSYQDADELRALEATRVEATRRIVNKVIEENERERNDSSDVHPIDVARMAIVQYMHARLWPVAFSKT